MNLTFHAVYAENDETAEAPYQLSTEENVLASLGIIVYENYDGRKGVTRADFTVSVIKLCGMGELSASQTKFSDVAQDAEYSGAVKAGTDMGFICGFEDNTFRPDGILTTEQAVKMVLSATGYDVYAKAYGGYPGGYLSVASVNGLLKKVGVGEYKECSWHDAALILYNALTMDILQQEKFPEPKYTKVDGENPLTKWLNVYVNKGVVTANEYTSVTSIDAVGEGTVLIDDEKYRTGKSNASDYLGYYVKVYYRDTSEREILICVPDSRCKAYEISSDDISEKTDENVLRVYPEKGLKDINIKNASFIFNGRKSALSKDKLLLPDSIVKVIDFEGDGKGDTVFVETYEHYCIDTVTPKSFSIVDKFSEKKHTFNIGKSGYDTVIYDKGEKVDFSAVKAGQVISVSQSEDKKYTKIMLGTEKVEGAVMEIGQNSISLDEGDGEYKLASNVIGRVSSLRINSVKTFTLTFDGKIGGWTDSKALGKYGYLISVAAGGKGIESGKIGSFRIFDVNSQKIDNYISAEEIRFCGNRTDENGEKFTGRSIMEKLMTGGKVKDQLIKFVTDKEGKITDLYVAEKNTEEPFEANPENFTLDYWLEYDGKEKVGDNPCRNHYYFGLYTWQDNSYGTIDGYISCKNTVMIGLPVLYGGETLMDREKDITVVNNKWFESDTMRLRFFELRVYDMDEYRQANVMVFRNHTGGTSGTLPAHEHILVDRISKVLDDGAVATKIFGYIGNTAVEYIVDSEAVSDGKISADDLMLKRGDVIRVATAPNVIRIIKIFSVKPDDGKGDYLIYSDGFADYQMKSSDTDYEPVPKPDVAASAGNARPNYEQMSIALYDRIKKADSTKGFVLTSDCLCGPTDRLAIIRYGDVNYSVYDEATDTARGGSFEDIDPDNPRQTVLMNLSYSRAHEICIYNWKEDRYPEWRGQY